MRNKPSRQPSTRKTSPPPLSPRFFASILHLFFFRTWVKILARSANRGEVQQIYALVSPYTQRLLLPLRRLKAVFFFSLGSFPTYLSRKGKKKKSYYIWATQDSWLNIDGRQTRHLVPPFSTDSLGDICTAFQHSRWKKKKKSGLKKKWRDPYCGFPITNRFSKDIIDRV